MYKPENDDEKVRFTLYSREFPGRGGSYTVSVILSLQWNMGMGPLEEQVF